MEWNLDEIGKIAGQVATAATTGYVVWRKLRLKALLWRRSMELSAQLTKNFGPDPSARIKELLDDIIQTADAMEVRQNIVCDHLGIGVYMCGLDARCTYANPKICEMFGMGREAMLGWGWLAAVSKADQVRVREVWTTAVKELLPYRETYYLRDGTLVRTEAFMIHSHECYVGYVVVVDPSDKSDNERDC